MIVLSIQNAPPKLRGYNTRYFWQIPGGIYVGNFNSKIRENIWKRVSDLAENETKAVLVYSTNNEQGFRVDTLHNSWQAIDFDGLQLMLKPFETEVQMHSVAEEYIVVDIETTGLNPEMDKIIEIGALLVRDGVILQEQDCIIKETVPKIIEELTGITQLIANEGIAIEDALKEMTDFIKGRDVVGYIIQQFNFPFILKACKDYDINVPIRKVIDVLPIVRKKIIGATSYKMNNIAIQLRITDNSAQHRAIPDAKLCKQIYDYCKGSYLP